MNVTEEVELPLSDQKAIIGAFAIKNAGERTKYREFEVAAADFILRQYTPEQVINAITKVEFNDRHAIQKYIFRNGSIKDVMEQFFLFRNSASDQYMRTDAIEALFVHNSYAFRIPEGGLDLWERNWEMLLSVSNVKASQYLVAMGQFVAHNSLTPRIATALIKRVLEWESTTSSGSGNDKKNRALREEMMKQTFKPVFDVLTNEYGELPDSWFAELLKK